MLVSCSSNQSKSIPSNPILCPETIECTTPVVGKMKTNKDLVNAYVKTSQSLGICVLGYNALKRCISDFNKSQYETKDTPK